MLSHGNVPGCSQHVQVYREEVLAYAEAVRRLRMKHQNEMLAKLLPGVIGQLPAPELDSVQPTLRVRHYMKKLGMFLMTDKLTRTRYNTAAARIQKAWTICRERKQKQEMMMMVRLPQCSWACHNVGILLCAERHKALGGRQTQERRAAFVQIQKLALSQQLFSKGFSTDEETLEVLMSMRRSQKDSEILKVDDISRASVFHVAAAVPGTGVSRGKTKKAPKKFSFPGDTPIMRRVTELGGMNPALFDQTRSSIGTGVALCLCSLSSQAVAGALQ